MQLWETRTSQAKRLLATNLLENIINKTKDSGLTPEKLALKDELFAVAEQSGIKSSMLGKIIVADRSIDYHIQAIRNVITKELPFSRLG